MSTPTEEEAPWIDPTVWRASSPCAVKIPAVGSRVYYFPQGHAEQCSSDPDFVSRSCYLLQTAEIRYLADASTDEVFVRISLVPPSPQHRAPPSQNLSPAEDVKSAKAHSKVLTRSDANNGGGFSVPKSCALSILPPLDFTETDTPVEDLKTTDLLGNRWTFRHIYRGNPRRHLFTRGWSKFVDAKKLVVGDSIVFIRKDEEVFIGIRRRQYCPSVASAVGFERDRRGRVAPEAVVEAVKAAEEGRPFDVDFYPGKGTPEVVVEERTVSDAMTAWPTACAVGTTVRGKVATDDTEASDAWHLGTVTAIDDYNGSPWAGSPWRMLQITWKDQEVLRNQRGVSPWQVEPIESPYATTSTLHRSDSLATNTTKMSEICDGPVRMDTTTGGLIVPPCDHNETFPVDVCGVGQDTNFATASNLEVRSPPVSCNNVPQPPTDSGNIAQVQIRLFGSTIMQSLHPEDADGDAEDADGDADGNAEEADGDIADLVQTNVANTTA